MRTISRRDFLYALNKLVRKAEQENLMRQLLRETVPAGLSGQAGQPAGASI